MSTISTQDTPGLDESVAKLFSRVQLQSLSAAGGLFMHGIFFLLFLYAVSYLFSPNRERIAGRTILRVTALLLAAFAIVQVALDVALAALLSNILDRKLATGHVPKQLMATFNAMYFTREGTLVLNNFVADALFLYRCRIIWGKHRFAPYIIGIGVLLILGTAVACALSVVYALNIRIPFGTALGTNIVLLAMTAGRIWYNGRTASAVLDRRMQSRWKAAVSIILESSLLYVAANIFYMISMGNESPFSQGAQNVLWGALAQVVNIVPLMIIVRVALHRSDEERTESQAALRSASAFAATSTSTSLTDRGSVVPIRVGLPTSGSEDKWEKLPV